MRFLGILTSCFFPFLHIQAQSSFSKYLDVPAAYIVYNMATYGSDEVSLLLYDFNVHSANVYYAKFKPPYDGGVEAYRIHSGTTLFSFPFNFVAGDDYFISQHWFGSGGGGLSGACIFYMDTSLQNHWLYYKPWFGDGYFGQLASGDITFFYSVASTSSSSPYDAANVVEGFVVDQAGQTLLQRGFQFVIEGHEDYIVQVEKMVVDEQSGKVFLLLSYRSGSSFLGSVLLILDESLNILSSVVFSGDWYRDMTMEVDGSFLYLLGAYEGEPIPGVSGGVLLTRLSADFDLDWSKLYYAEHFDYKRAALSGVPSGGVNLVYSTEGAFPTILAKLNEAGEIEEQTGYPFYEPLVAVLDDGSLCMVSNQTFDQSGQTTFQIEVAKTDASGNIEGCEVFSTCLLSEDRSLSFGEVEIDTLSVSDLLSVEVQIEPWGFNFIDGCNLPPAPNPNFLLPDTVCVGTCVSAEDLHNQLAHGVQWHLSGPGGTDEVVDDSLSFSKCFENPGTYELSQTVWFLGCPYSYSRQVVVLENLEGGIEPEGVLCNPPPATLSVSADRPLLSFSWNSGSSQDEVLEVSQSGTYTAEVTDGYCVLRDTVVIDFLDELLTEGPGLLLPEDTSVCEQRLPYVLRPYSPYLDSFAIEGALTGSGTSFSLWQEGTYEVQAEVYGCPLTDEFALEVNDCSALVYLPTAFSPDGDGINDQYFPQGKYFEGISLSIYDRWGGMLYQASSPPFLWDGLAASGERAPAGMYIACFEYLNLRLQEVEQRCGELYLIR